MTKTTPPGPAYFSTAFKLVAGGLTVLGTLATILTTARQEGMLGPLRTAGVEVAHLRITPNSDTAWALGDTLHFAVAAADTNGVILAAPDVEWAVTNTEVATVGNDGSVVAMGAGETSVVVTAGRAVARARVVVHPRAEALRVTADTLQLPEGTSTSLIAIPYDLHGRAIRGPMAEWTTADTTVISVDTLGLATGLRPGTATTYARLDAASARLVVQVTPVLGALALGNGDGQHAAASTTLPAPVVVRTLSRQGPPLGGVLVRAAVDAGTLATDTVRSDEHGQARFVWTLGDRPGPQHLIARADGIDSTVTATAEADPVAANTRFGLVDSLGTARAGSALPSSVVVRLTDTLGQVLPNVPVRWLGLDGSRIVGEGPRTDSLGLARATWILGPKVGRNRGRLIAGPANTPAFPFETRSAAGAPARITILAGDRPRAPVASSVRLRVRISDAEGNPVPEALLQSELGSGTVALIDPFSKSDGTVRLDWTLGPIAGSQALTLRIGAARTTITATVLPAPPAKVEIVAPGITIVSSASIRVVALVTDSLGNPIRGNVVQPRVSMGSVTPLRALTGTDGRATFTWTVARRQGEQTITVRAAGVREAGTKTIRRPVSR